MINKAKHAECCYRTRDHQRRTAMTLRMFLG